MQELADYLLEPWFPNSTMVNAASSGFDPNARLPPLSGCDGQAMAVNQLCVYVLKIE